MTIGHGQMVFVFPEMRVVLVDPVTVVVTALVAGAATGVSNTVSTAVQDAYQALCDAVRRRLAGGRGGRSAEAEVLDAYLQDPVGEHSRLVDALTEAGAEDEPELIEAAKRVFALTFPSENTVGKYAVDLRGAQGAIVGDGATQTNTFS